MEQPKTLTLAQPPGLTLFPTLPPPHKTLTFHQITFLLLTFLAYASFHASRKPPSIVKSVLSSSPTTRLTDPIPVGNAPVDTGWAPFNGSHGPHRLGELDLAFLSAYSAGMYFAAHIGDRIDLRVFLTIGMLGSGVFTILFGVRVLVCYNSLGFFVIVQICCGIVQSIGWPCVVAVMGNWFGKSKRGLIMGIWSSNASVGNIIGSVIASSILGFGWGWAFVLPGMLVIVVSVVVFTFLVVDPEDVGLELLAKEVERDVEGVALVSGGKVDLGDEEGDVVSEDGDLSSSNAIGFWEAWRLPGVAPFAFCLFFSKLVASTFLYWLPFYLRHTAVAGVHLSDKPRGSFQLYLMLAELLVGFWQGTYLI